MHGVGEVYGKCNAKYLVQGAYLEPQTITSSCGQIQDLNLKWVGDLSLQDAHLLHHYTLNTQYNIIEFGVGGSTHIIAQTKGCNRKLISIDTSLEWIEMTNKILQRLHCTDCFFVLWEQWAERVASLNLEVDLVFNDGFVGFREQFGIQAWPLLKPGGFMIYHDTRHLSVVQNITKLIDTYYNEIEEVKINEKWQEVSSNLTVIKKKRHEPYVNWNHVENKPQWRYGHPEFGPPPESYWNS